MTLSFDPTQTVSFLTPQIGKSFNVGGCHTDAALARAALQWEFGAQQLAQSTEDWYSTVQNFLRDTANIDVATAWRLACQ